MNTLKFLSADTGAGKTRSLINSANASTEKFLIVQNTKNLITQTHSSIPDSTYILSGVNSENVLEDVTNFLIEPTNRVLIITDVTFLKLEDMNLLKDWHIYVDDVVNFHQFYTANNITVETKSVLMNVIFTDFEDVGEADDVKYCTCKKRENITDQIANSIANGDLAIIDRNDSFIMNTNFFEMETTTVAGMTVSTPNTKCNQLSIYAWKDLTKYLGLDITFMAAAFEDTLIYKSHSQYFEQIDFDGLDVRKVPVRQRLKVFYFSKENRMTKTLRQENPELVKKVIDYIEMAVQVPFYYTANSDLLRGMKFTNGTQVKIDLRGMNDLKDYTACVWLASMKPSTVEMKQAELFFNISKEEMIKAREYQSLYQWVTRGISRVYDSEEIQTVYVFDEEQARTLSDNIEFIDLGLDDAKPKTQFKNFSTNVQKRYSRIGTAKKITNIEQFKAWVNSDKNSDLTTREKELFIQRYIEVSK